MARGIDRVAHTKTIENRERQSQPCQYHVSTIRDKNLTHSYHRLSLIKHINANVRD